MSAWRKASGWYVIIPSIGPYPHVHASSLSGEIIPRWSQLSQDSSPQAHLVEIIQSLDHRHLMPTSIRAETNKAGSCTPGETCEAESK